MNLDESIQYAARFLPDMWEVVVSVECGAAWVDLFDDAGNSVEQGPVDRDETLGECVQRLVEKANPNASTTPHP